MNKRLKVMSLGLSLSSFLVITYVLCVLFGLLVSDRGMHQLLGQLMPGFTWITWPSFFVGLIWSFIYGWYVAVLFAPLFNFFSRRSSELEGK
ncbi:MAG: hypothetical protein K2Y71_15490 [Xanthobacteraceae bacterium]|nr:hypothetical protein [Xanthobacteraceae bacterium]